MPKRRRQDSVTDELDLLTADDLDDADESKLLDVELVQKDFDRDDLAYLCRNEHDRFMPSSTKVGQALIYDTGNQAKAIQFAPPTYDRIRNSELKVDVQIRPLTNIRAEIDSFGSYSKEYLRAETPNGTEMFAKRYVTLTVSDDKTNQRTEYQRWCFSPVQENIWARTGKPFIGAGPEDLPIFRSDLSPEVLKDLNREFKELNKDLVKHHEFEITHETVLERERRSNLSRKPTQNEVMAVKDVAFSAFKAVQSFGSAYSEELHPERLAIIEKNNKAENIRQSKLYERQHRHEWGHAMAYSLTAMNVDPQVPENLAAMPMHVNTGMMVPERLAKYIGLHRLAATMKGEVHFNMIPGTDILNDGYSKYTFKEGSRSVSVHMLLNNRSKYANFPKATDIGQTVMAAYNLLVGSKPISVQTVPKKQPGEKNILGLHTSAAATATSSAPAAKKTAVATKPSNLNTATIADMFLPMPGFTPVPPYAATNYMPEQQQNVSVPGQQQNVEMLKARRKALRNSLVQVSNESFVPLYAAPWRSVTFMNSHGSGVVIKLRGKLYILTNAHVAENHIDLRVRLANKSKQYPAKVVNIGYQCDLALLEVESEEFAQLAAPLPFSDHMVQPHDFIEVYGFPTGGDELCYTNGPVSRIELGIYEEGGEHNLWAQTQAPVNPGNSGGPILMDGKIVGLAFQSLFLHDGVHYVIPMPVIKHFLKDTFSPGGYKGFPSIQMDLQRIEGDEQHKSCHLAPDISGVRIVSIDTLSDVYGKLMVDDIITQIDDMPVSDDEKIDVPGIGTRLDLNYAWLRKHVGDTVKITVLRKKYPDPDNLELEQKEFEIELQHMAAHTKKVGMIEYDKYPTFLISDLVVFQPLSPNMIETEDGKELITFHTEDDKYLQDVAAVNSGDQLIRVTCVFKHDGTFGSNEEENKFVNTVNGKKVNNMFDLINALREPINGQTIILLRDKTRMAVRKMSHAEHVAILRKRGITNFCSDDLLPQIKDGLDPVPQSLPPAPPAVPETQLLADDNELELQLDFANESVMADQTSDAEDAAAENVNDDESVSSLSEDDDDEEELRLDAEGFIADDDDILADRDAQAHEMRIGDIVAAADATQKKRVTQADRAKDPMGCIGIDSDARYAAVVKGIAIRAAAEAAAQNAARSLDRKYGNVADKSIVHAHDQKRRKLKIVTDDDDDDLPEAPTLHRSVAILSPPR